MRAFHSIDLGGLQPQGTKTGFSLRTTSRLPIPCEHGVIGLLTSPGDTTSRVDVKAVGAAPPLEGFHAHPKGVLQFHFDHRDTVAVGQTSGSAPISHHIAPLWPHQSGRRGKNEDVRAAPSAAPSDARFGLLQERPPCQTADALDDPGALPCVLCRTRRAPLFWATQNGATEFGTLSTSSYPRP